MHVYSAEMRAIRENEHNAFSRRHGLDKKPFVKKRAYTKLSKLITPASWDAEYAHKMLVKLLEQH